MKLPAGYQGQGERISCNQQKLPPNAKSGKVCKLIKSLHGLKQALRQWFAKLSSALLGFGFKQSRSDYSLFSKKQGSSFTAILIYVDDMLVIGNDLQAIQELKTLLNTQFHMKDLGDLRYFLGLEVARNEQGLFISQNKYALDLLHEVGLDTVKALNLPMDPHVKLTATGGTPLKEPEVYRTWIGKLIYLTITRPDLSYSVQELSLCKHHLQNICRLLYTCLDT